MTYERFRRGKSILLALFLSATMVSACRAAEKTGTAADVVPADCAFFTTSVRLKEQMDAFCQSNAVKKARNSQIGKMLEAQLRNGMQRGEGKQFMDFLESPTGQDVVKILKSAGKDEIFLFGDNGWGEILAFLNEMNMANYKATAASIGKGGRPDQLKTIVELVKSRKPKLPSIVVGFKFSEWETLNKYLDQAMQMVPQIPVPIKQETIKTSGGDIRTLSVSGSLIPKDKFLNDMKDEVDEKTAQEMYDWLSKQTFTIGIGKWNDYLILSFGPDAKSVERLGSGTAIANHADFAPASKHMSAKLLSIGYVSADFISKVQMNAQDMMSSVDQMIDSMKEKMPAGLADRLKSDLKSIGTKVEKSSAKPTAVVTVSVENRGVESFTYTKTPSPLMDYSKPLTILERAGKDAMLTFAIQSPSGKDDYNDIVEFLKKGYGYWTDFGLKQLEGEAAEIAKKLEGPVLNFLKKIDNINRTKLVPATDAGQSLFVIDTKGKFDGIPFVFQADKSLPMLEVATAFTVTDGKLFEQGMSEYLDAADELIANIAPLFPDAQPLQKFRIPRPTAFPSGNNGVMYTYPLLGSLERNMMPHALVGDKLVVLATHQSISQRMAAGNNAPTSDVVKLGEPSGDVVIFRLDGFCAAVKEWLAYFEKDPKGPFGHVPEQARPMVKEGIDLTFELIGTFKGMTARSFKDGDYIVNHTWLHFEDLKN